MNYLYLIINFGSVIIPLIFSFHPKLSFYKKWAQAWPAILIVALAFIAWDIEFTKRGIWGFNEKYLSGIYIANLPLEEVLFFICIPYACLFTYHCLKLLIKNNYIENYINTITITLILLLAIFAFVYCDKAYTSLTFFLLCLLLLFLFIKKNKWLGLFYISYLVLLIPFFVVNGILTGTMLSEPIVWYNNHENMNIRILTIPLEDFFYGKLMILSNVFLFETFFTKITLLNKR